MTLVLDHLGFAYPDGTAIGPVSLRADAGVVRLHGENGTGKSTLLRVIGGVLPASEGTVRLHGRDPFAEAPVRAHIGAVTADPELPPFLTATEAWQQWAAFRGKPDWDGASRLEALGLPPHLRLGHMSSGQRRRAELVAALAGDPSLLLLDETFTHLDDAGVAWLAAEIERGRAQRVVLLAHHGTPPVGIDDTVVVPPARRP
ncbi:MAG: ATP-binding cassette domain-containing protein [Deltaproteobacteria bacterium]|nr:MAG: ATP-binding cassette domain-containing protein [Deltaproteobacteria bacterium]